MGASLQHLHFIAVLHIAANKPAAKQVVNDESISLLFSPLPLLLSLSHSSNPEENIYQAMLSSGKKG